MVLHGENTTSDLKPRAELATSETLRRDPDVKPGTPLRDTVLAEAPQDESRRLVALLEEHRRQAETLRTERDQARLELERSEHDRRLHLEAFARQQRSIEEMVRIKGSLLYGALSRTVGAEYVLRRFARKLGLRRPSSWRRVGEPAQAHSPNPAEPAVVTVQAIGPRPRPAGEERPLLVCLSHVVPWPPRAGNEYRIHRMLSRFQSGTWDVLLLLCPPLGSQLSDKQIATLSEKYGNFVIIGRPAALRYRLARHDVAEAVEALAGRQLRPFSTLLREDRDGNPLARLLGITRPFCPDILIETLASIDAAVAPRVILANYGFMTRGFPMLQGQAIKIVDTHDVFSTKAHKVSSFGIDDGLAVTATEESELLRPADLLLAIQPEEAAELRAILPKARIMTVGVDMPPPPVAAVVGEAPVVLLVASDNDLNTKGLRDFLRFGWPSILAAVPGAELHVVGAVGDILSGHEAGVRRLGRVDDLAKAYAQARLVINPAVAGTGLKIKTLEALSNLRPIVLWPSGVDGVPQDLRELCACVTDWFAFRQAVIELLRSDAAALRVIEARDKIAALLSPAHVYGELETALERRA